MQTSRTISWKIDKQGATAEVTFEGEINEAVSFEQLVEELSELSGSLTFDLAGIRRLNSEGVRQWVKLMRAISEVDEIKTILYKRCSVAIVSQINMIKDFQGRAEIVSIYAPYTNEESGDEEHRLLQIADIADAKNPPTFKDDEGGLWELDEIPERYFAFLLQS